MSQYAILFQNILEILNKISTLTVLFMKGWFVWSMMGTLTNEAVASFGILRSLSGMQNNLSILS